MEIDGVTKKMSSGDAVLIPAGAWHQITANEDGPIRLLCCCAPPILTRILTLSDKAFIPK